jgi:peptide/nickel transport system permease protein
MSATTAGSERTREGRSRPGLDLLRKALRHGLVVGGGSIVLLLGVLAAFGASLAPYDPLAMDFGARFAPPSWAHPFGTDDFGRDLFSRVLHGAAVSFQVAFIAVGISGVAGVALGVLAGYLRAGWSTRRSCARWTCCSRSPRCCWRSP